VTNGEYPVAGDYTKLFVIGCPRSGTTWVQLLLSQHGAVATAPETQIFAYYLNHLERQWVLEHESADRQEQGRAGLSRVLSEEEFVELCRMGAQLVLEKIRSTRPGSAVVAEKSPKHALHAAFIQRVFPDAVFLHVIRDPRDTAASLLAASRSWGRDWAPANAVVAARMWVEHIEKARQVRSSSRYREVLYEQLKSDAVGELQRILEWLAVPAARAESEAAVAACGFRELQESKADGALPLPGSALPHGFFRRGEAGGWRAELPARDVRVIEHICGQLMEELGYERSTRNGAPPFRIAVHDGIQRVRESVDWQLARVLRRV
jgi:hypothetical protein